MPKRNSKAENYGGYIWRGGQKIPVEKQEDRFTVIPSNSEQLERLRTAPGVRAIKRVTNNVFKVETTTTERDAAMASIRSDAYKAIAHHAYHPSGSEGTVFYITDKLIVRFAPKARPAQMDQLLEKYGLKVLKEYEGQKNTFLIQVTSTSSENPIKIANRLAEEKLVLSAEPNMVNRFMPSHIPKDGYFRRQWHLSAKDSSQLVGTASIDAPTAWDITCGERNIVIALIDDGFDLGHQDFTGPGKIVFPKDYVDGDANPFPESGYRDYHGTPCAGVAVAEMNGRGVVGIAAGCAFMPVRFPLAADDDLLIEIFETTAQHADVISCSWGPPPVFAPLSSSFSDVLERLATTGGPRGHGVVLCFAAANFDAPINDPQNVGGFVWLDYGSDMLRRTVGPILNGLAAHPNVIAVSSSTSLNKHAAYSNWGAEVSVCAPSNNFHPLDPRQFVPGRAIWTTDNEAFGDGFTAHSRYTGHFGGTSSATPLTAGVAALVLSANPNLSAAEVKEILQTTADRIVDDDPDIVLGTNRGHYDGRGHSDWFGFGKVNAGRAVTEAVRRRNIGVATLSTRLEDVIAELTGNESLLEMLGTDAATEMLDWGIATVTSLVERTAGLDDEAAHQQLQPSLKAVRQIMRTVGNWSVGKYTDHSSRLELRNILLENLKHIFIDNAYLPSPEEMDNLLKQVDDKENSPQQLILKFKQLFSKVHVAH